VRDIPTYIQFKGRIKWHINLTQLFGALGQKIFTETKGFLQVSAELQDLIREIVKTKESNNQTKLTVLKRAMRSNLVFLKSIILCIRECYV
jgi:hypothetical protein